MSKPAIFGTTISIEFGDKEYGNGSQAYMNLQGRYPEPGKPIDELDDVIIDGLDMYFAAWKSLLAGRYASGVIDGKTFKEQLAATTAKFEKVRNFLKREAENNA
jgi:hypothetical protein